MRKDLVPGNLPEPGTTGEPDGCGSAASATGMTAAAASVTTETAAVAGKGS